MTVRARPVFIAALYAALSVLLCARAFAQPNAAGWLDWDQHLFYYASVLRSVVEYGQLPFWNPWYCGGNVLWQNPQVALLSPAYPLALVMSLPLAMKLNIALHYFMGFAGMHLLLRRVARLTSLPLTVFLATVYVGCGAITLHLGEGHSTFLPALYLPLQLFWISRSIAEGTVRHALLAGAALALTIWNGGQHIVPMMAVGIGAFSLTAAIARRRWRPLVLALVCGVAGAAYAAPKLVPMMELLESDRFKDDRALGVKDSMTVDMVRHAYVDRNQERLVMLPGQVYGWHEYGNYIGWPAALLIAASLGWIFIKPRPHEEWLGTACAVAAVMLLLLSLGDFGRFSPATLARSVPVLSRFRISSRYTIAFVLFAVTAVGCALRQLPAEVMRRRAVQWLVAIGCIVAAGDVVAQNSRFYEASFRRAPLDRRFEFLRRGDAPIQDVTIDPYLGDAPMLRALMSDRATFRCYEPLGLIQLTAPERPLVFAEGPLSLTTAAFTPNRIDVTIASGQAPSRLFINQNYAPGWRTALGPIGPDPGYRNVSIQVSPGTSGTYSVRFVPPGLLIGWAIFAMSIAGSVWLWRRRLA